MTTDKTPKPVNLVAVDQAVAEAVATRAYQRTVSAYRRALAKISDAQIDGVQVDALIWGGLGLHPTAVKMQARKAADAARAAGALPPGLSDEAIWQVAELCARMSMLTFRAVAEAGE